MQSIEVTCRQEVGRLTPARISLTGDIVDGSTHCIEGCERLRLCANTAKTGCLQRLDLDSEWDGFHAVIAYEANLAVCGVEGTAWVEKAKGHSLGLSHCYRGKTPLSFSSADWRFIGLRQLRLRAEGQGCGLCWLLLLRLAGFLISALVTIGHGRNPL